MITTTVITIMVEIPDMVITTIIITTIMVIAVQLGFLDTAKITVITAKNLINSKEIA